jgi:predicted Fe-S protein YdhL (DUF1289 family)
MANHESAAPGSRPVQDARAVSRPGGAARKPDGAFVMTDSPCVAVCSTLYDDICRGCGRTAMEVANWVCMGAEEKRAVWARIRAQGYPRRP